MNIPESVTSVGDYAFRECAKIWEIELPANVSSLGKQAFYECANLVNVSLPEGLPVIEGYTFYKCRNLYNINIPSTVTSIGSYAFASCGSLPEITIPGSVKSIGNNAFDNSWGSSALRKISLSEGIETIGNEAFAGCENLSEVVIPESVTSIGDAAFRSTNLSKVTLLPEMLVSIGADAFNVLSDDVTVFVHSDMLDEYRSLEAFVDFSVESLPVSVKFPSLAENLDVKDGMLYNPEGLDITIYDSAGTLVYKGNAVSIKQPAGVYILRCGSAVKKITF